MDFFNQIFLDNTIKSYCLVGLTILIVLIFKRYFSRYIALQIYHLLHRIWYKFDKTNFISLVVEPLEWVLLILISVIAIDKLNFPEDLRFSIYGFRLQNILSGFGSAIIIISITWFMLRVIDFVAMVLEQKASITKSKSDDQLVIFFRDFLKIIIAIIGFLILLKACFKQPIGNLLTSLSIVGAALALAAKESLENLIASFVIFFDKPFTVGDTVTANGVTGEVEKIGLRSTRLRTGSTTLVTVPNKKMVDSIVDNLSKATQQHIEIKLELAPATNYTAIKEYMNDLKNYMQSKEGQISKFDIHLTDISKTANIIAVEYFTTILSDDEAKNLKEEINFNIKEILEKNAIILAPLT